MHDNTYRNQLIATLHSLRGLSCWAVSAGKGAGSRVLLELGKKVLRSKPLRNPTVSEDLRRYIGEYALFIEGCAWRLEESGEILCTWKTGDTETIGNGKGVGLLNGRRIVSIESSMPGCDLSVSFDEGLILRTFSDCYSDDDGDNFTVYSPHGNIAVGARGVIRMESSRE